MNYLEKLKTLPEFKDLETMPMSYEINEVLEQFLYQKSCDIIDIIDYDGVLNEAIDGMIDLYYYDIRKWAVENWEYVERAIDEGLTDTENFDYHKTIQAGQYVYYQEQANDYLEAISALLVEAVENE